MKLGNVWAAKAKIQYMGWDGDKRVWKTLATCMDTPNAIIAAAKKLEKRGVCLMNQMWVIGDVTCRKMVNDI